jgi:O-antigen ligase
MAGEVEVDHAGQSLRAARALTLAAVVAAASISTMEILLGLALLAWLGRLLVGPRREGLPDAELVLLLGGLAAWSLISAVNSADSGRALESVGAGLLWLAAPLATAVLHRDGRQVVRAVLLLQAGLLGIWSLAEFTLWWGGDPLLRVHGPFSHHMTLAGFLLVAVLQGLPRPTLWPLMGQRWGRLGGGAAAALGTAGLAVTMTRSAVLALACGWAVLLFTSSASPRKAWRVAMAMILVLGVAAAVSLPWVVQRAEVLPAAGTASIDDRLHLWQAGGRMIQEHPWFGVGAHLTRTSVAEYLDPEYRRPGMPAHLHGAWMTLAAERGLPALLILLALSARSAIRARRLLAGGIETDLVRGSLAALAGFLIMGLFEDNFDDTEVLFLHLITLTVLWQGRPWRAGMQPPS